jgi:citrate lyase subunit beta/citryl-CoA lyase
LTYAPWRAFFDEGLMTPIAPQLRAWLIATEDSVHDLTWLCRCKSDAIIVAETQWPFEAEPTELLARETAFWRSLRKQAKHTKIFPIISNLDLLQEDHLTLLIQSGVDGVFLETCDGRNDLQHLSIKLSVSEATLGLANGVTPIIAQAAATPQSVFFLNSYAQATPRLQGMVFDEARLALALDATRCARTPTPITSIRDQVVLAAAAAGVPAYLRPATKAYDQAWHDGFNGIIGATYEEINVIKASFASLDRQKATIDAL